jgi:hypothetical protein
MRSAAKSKPPKVPPSAKAGGCDIIFRRPGSAAGKNPDPRATPGSRRKFAPPPGKAEAAAKLPGKKKDAAWQGGEDGADAALLRALKMAGIDRAGDSPQRPGTAQRTRDALHSEEQEGPAKLEQAYMDELSVAWDSALSDHRPPTASAEARAMMGVDTGPCSQKAGEVIPRLCPKLAPQARTSF